LSDKAGWDILYLVCHLTIKEHKAMLLLEDREGEVLAISARELVDRIAAVPFPPRGLILVSGKTRNLAGNPMNEQRRGLMKTGAVLLQCGIPVALIADGNDPRQRIDVTLPMFFWSLRDDDSPYTGGRADEALAKAQNELSLRQPWDPWWTLVLVSRQKTSRLWYKPGFLKVEQSDAIWERLRESIRNTSKDSGNGGKKTTRTVKCTPVIGPGLVQNLVGSRREMAQTWADKHFFPMSSHDRINLPQVAQYLQVNWSHRRPRDPTPECSNVSPERRSLCAELTKNFRSYIQTRFRGRFPRSMNDWPISRIFSWAARDEIGSNDREPHRILAALDLPLYVTANQNLLLEDALCRHYPEYQDAWDLLEQHKEQPFVYPSEVAKRVCHVFGDMNHMQEIVITEDDYFEFLLDASRGDKRVPYRVRSALTTNSLLFLGFRLYHWDFRVLFQLIKGMEGSDLLLDRPHVAVQVDPDDDYIVDPERARRYLESYFADSSVNGGSGGGERNHCLQVSIYWGTPVDFLRDLNEQLSRVPPSTDGA
jgi:hypothetical protein